MSVPQEFSLAPQKKRTSCGCMILYGVLGVIGLLIVVGIIGFLATPPGVPSTPLTTSAPTITPTSGPPTDTPMPTPTPFPTPLPVQATGVVYQQICGVDESNMTDPQLQTHAAQFAGQTFTGWRGWVYDVTDQGGAYNLEIAMEERGMFWLRNIVIENIPNELAVSLNVEQPIVFSGRVAKVDYAFEVMCNPLYIDNFALQQ